MPTKEELQAAFKVFDADGDGFITRDEFIAILTRPTSKRSHSKQEAEAIFAKADRNNDGRVDIDEFAAAWGANDLHDGWSFWGYSLHQNKVVSKALTRAIAMSGEPRAERNRSVCGDWSHRQPLRVLIEHHYSRITTSMVMASLGPYSPMQQVARQCNCRVVLVTRLREPLSFYISFYRWTVFWRQLRNSTEFGSTMIEWAPANLQSAMLLRPLDATWAGRPH